MIFWWKFCKYSNGNDLKWKLSFYIQIKIGSVLLIQFISNSFSQVFLTVILLIVMPTMIKIVWRVMGFYGSKQSNHNQKPWLLPFLNFYLLGWNSFEGKWLVLFNRSGIIKSEIRFMAFAQIWIYWARPSSELSWGC